MTDTDRYRAIRAEIEAERDAREAALAGKVAELLGLTPRPAPKPDPEPATGPEPEPKDKPITDPDRTDDAELQIGQALLGQLGRKPRAPERQPPPLTLGKIRELAGGPIDYEGRRRDREQFESQVRADALRVARRGGEDREWAVEWARRHGVDVAAEAQAMTDQETS